MTGDRQELQRVPPERFVAARNALVKKLRDAGEAAEAKEVVKLRRPTKLLWALNRLGREQPDAIRRLLEAGAEVRAAHEELLAGEDARDRMRVAEKELRSAIDALAEIDPTPRVAELLRAAALGGPAVGRALAEGALEKEPDMTGSLGDASEGAGAPARRRKKQPTAKARAAASERARRDARKEAAKKEKLRHKAELLRRRARQLAEDAAEAERRAREAEAATSA